MQRKSKHFPSISRLHFGCCLALPLHPSHGLFSLKLFHFTNICWQRGIANLSRAFFQISLLRQNADLSYCRCSHVFMFFFSILYFIFLMDWGEKNLMPTIHSITNVLILCSQTDSDGFSDNFSWLLSTQHACPHNHFLWGECMWIKNPCWGGNIKLKK